MSMPATVRRKDEIKIVSEPKALGADGCRAGWVWVALSLADNSLAAGIDTDFSALKKRAGPATKAMMIDMPIGLADEGRRGCETQARTLLKPLRHNSVFSSPRRPMLGFVSYEEANQWGKAQPDTRGLSKQAWMIAPKIREIDRLMSPALQRRVSEAHPEVAFWRLNDGEPCRYAKRKPEGAYERLMLLKKHGIKNADDLYEALRQDHGRGIARDDVYDACALALTAKARLEGKAIHLTDGAKDARGLLMEIWG